ncbi:hypothetical protein KAT42_02540 [Candidatus Bathyarchaeota archaeon]|nr:hypothetical protein [Candidatus Bathyarchaeota archaeon]
MTGIKNHYVKEKSCQTQMCARKPFISFLYRFLPGRNQLRKRLCMHARVRDYGEKINIHFDAVVSILMPNFDKRQPS